MIMRITPLFLSLSTYTTTCLVLVLRRHVNRLRELDEPRRWASGPHAEAGPRCVSGSVGPINALFLPLNDCKPPSLPHYLPAESERHQLTSENGGMEGHACYVRPPGMLHPQEEVGQSHGRHK